MKLSLRSLRKRFGFARGVKVDPARVAAVRERLTKPSPPDGAFVVGPWGWGLSAEEADRRIKKWRKLLTIHGLTVDEVARDMATW